MAAGIEDYEQTYQQAYLAYVERNYEEAATLIDQVLQSVADDPNIRLLRGHVYYVLQQYNVAEAEYKKVLELTDDPNITTYAHNGLAAIEQYQQELNEDAVVDEDENQNNILELSQPQEVEKQEDLEDLEDLGDIKNYSSNSFDLKSFEANQAITDEMEELPVSNPFDISLNDSAVSSSESTSQENLGGNPFAVESEKSTNSGELSEIDLPDFLHEGISGIDFGTEQEEDSQISGANSSSKDSPFAQLELPSASHFENQSFFSAETLEEESNTQDFYLKTNATEDETLLVNETDSRADSISNSLGYSSQEKLSHSIEQEASTNSYSRNGTSKSMDVSSSLKNNFADSNFSFEEKHLNSGSKKTQTSKFEDDDSFDFEAFESAFGSDDFSKSEEKETGSGNISKGNNIEFLDDFDEFDDLGNIPGFNIADDDSQLRSTPLVEKQRKAEPVSSPENNERDSELFSITGSQEGVPVFTQGDVSKIEPQVAVEQGFLAPLENAPLQTKQWITAGTVGVVSALVVATVSFAAANFSPPQQRESVRNTGWAMTLAAGIAGFASASIMGNLAFKQIRRTTQNLQAQFDAVSKGNLSVQATVYSEDELGQLAASFNEMARIIFTTTNEATRKAQEQEEAKENLQRQVIRLLDDVEGAARGDLTVQAEVTADVLGAVADAFNLTIQNLRDIVQQVKVAAREVTRGATNSETFARALSSDALRQAEELAVTLNSVQVMTDSIQRVAEAAREAEAVARDASQIALKGGDAVENTVAGILEIRETVAETTRKVKRLAESSQEISKIVALISQIASRTNLLALNASIEAARAGEAGRGFAIVADEVRQLADKSAKSLKEIEQIVMQIQSETGSVMTAMEEGTQQVIQGTKLAEEAKRSLENIIQVAKRIDSLVRGITADTVEQTETSRAVAQVMQSVELTAQETSQEAQRVSGALQHLVGVSRDLIASVERFRVETAENTR